MSRTQLTAPKLRDPPTGRYIFGSQYKPRDRAPIEAIPGSVPINVKTIQGGNYYWSRFTGQADDDELPEQAY